MHGEIRESVEKALDHAIKMGTVDETAHAPLIAMLRYMSDYLDSDTGDTPPTRYVTPASFMNYCQELGLTPSTAPKQQKQVSKLAEFDPTKYGRAANA